MTEVTPKSAASDTLASAPTARLLTRSLNSSVVEGCAKIYREEACHALREDDFSGLWRRARILDIPENFGAAIPRPTGVFQHAHVAGLAGPVVTVNDSQVERLSSNETKIAPRLTARRTASRR